LNGKYVLRHLCRVCEKSDQLAYRERKKAKKLASITWDVSTHNKCKVCGVIKELSSFKKAGNNNYCNTCIDCANKEKSEEVGYDVTTHRRCSDCGDLKKIDEFAKKREHGREGKCKVCIARIRRERAKKRAKDPIAVAKERQRGRDRQYWKTDSGITGRRRRTMRHAIRELGNLLDKETTDRFNKDPRRLIMLWGIMKMDRANYKSDSPKRRECRNVTRNAIDRGDIIRQPCEHPGCGKTINDNGTAIEAHHNDYNNPLDITWYCIPHHGEHHVRLNAEAYLKRIKEVDEHFFMLDGEPGYKDLVYSPSTHSDCDVCGYSKLNSAFRLDDNNKIHNVCVECETINQ